VFLKRFFRPFILSLIVLVFASGAAHCAQESDPSKAAQNAGPPYMRALGAAATAYMQRDFDTALKKLDLADQVAPNIPDTYDMRGAIYAEQHAYEKAEDAFEKAGQLNPGDFWPPYNIASLLLMQKKYPEAVDAFKKLAVYSGHEELVQFKIVFTDLLAGKPEDAKTVLDAMKFPSDTPAYYYAQAAWAFFNKDQKAGNYWSSTGLKVFNLEKCLPFYDALATQHWLPMRNANGSVPHSDTPSFSGKLDDSTGGETAPGGGMSLIPSPTP
jgi:tetratricopeptide (TPR) repeat protein